MNFKILKSLMALSLIFLFTQCAPKISSKLLIIENRAVGGISIGMPIEKAIQISEREFSVEKTRNIYIEEGNHYVYNVTSPKGNKTQLYSFNGGYNNKNKDKVFRILISSPVYFTREAIHPGMTLGDLRSKAKLKTADFNYTDGLFIQSGAFEGGYWMDLEGENTNNMNLENPVINKLPGHLKIKAIVLF